MLNLPCIVFVIIVSHSLQHLWFVSTYPVAAVVCLLKIQRNHGPVSSLRTEEHDEVAGSAESLQSLHRDGSKSAKSPYTEVQTLSFQIYTGGAPAFTVDKSTGKERKNHECKGCEYNSV